MPAKAKPDARPDSRTRLVAAAARLFQERGYAATGLSEILEAAGSPKGSLYHHFPGGKAELASAAMAGAGMALCASLDAARRASPDAATTLERFADMLAGWLEGSRFELGCPMATVALECAPGMDAVTDTLRSAFDETSARLAVMIEQDGIAPERAQALAELALASVEGALILARVRKDAAPVRAASREIARLIRGEMGGSV